MKKMLLLLLFSYAWAPQAQERKNQMSLSFGLDCSTETYTAYYGNRAKSFIGVLGELEYMRYLSPYFDAGISVLVGGRNHKNYAVEFQNYTAGILVSPFGEKFRNFRLGVRLGCFSHLSRWSEWRYVTRATLPGLESEGVILTEETVDIHRRKVYFANDYVFRFYVIDHPRYNVGFGVDIPCYFDKGDYAALSWRFTLRYGLKF